MAKTKNTGGTHLGRDSRPKFLGVKLFDGQAVKIGSVIVRQRGSRILAGKNVEMGSDNTLYATSVGVIKFRQTKKTGFSGARRLAKVVDVIEAKK
jgi:large subunit ribosomal protein L27